MRSSILLLACLGLGGKAIAAPNVVADIAPVHSLVSQVMGTEGTPELLIPPTQSPHEGVLRPSQARALAGADLVVWIGPGLTPWLADTLEGRDAETMMLLEVPGTALLAAREAGVAEGLGLDDHDHGHGDHDDHDDHDDEEHDEDKDHNEHDDHDEHDENDEHADEDDHDDHEEHAEHDEHDDHDEHAEDEDHDDHDQGDHALNDGITDPHAWLDPENARVWVAAIAEALAELDPSGAPAYRANAAAAIERLEALEADMAAALAPVADRPYVVMHDAFAYVEAHFGLREPSRLSAGDAAPAGPRAISNMRAFAAQEGVRCFFIEPQQAASGMEPLLSSDEQSIHVLDPIGVSSKPGPDHYNETMRAFAGAMAGCQ